MRLKYYLLTILPVLTLCGCVDTSENSGFNRVEVTLNQTMPEEINDAKVKSGKIHFTELNTRSEYTFSLPVYDPYLVPAGLYDVEAEAVAETGDGKAHTLRASTSSVAISSASSVSLDYFFYNPENSLIFSEIYVVGSLNATSTGGLRDSYFRIYNNTDEVIYADGIGIAESAFINARASQYEILTEANDRQKNFTASTIWVIPGNGTQHPVNPGESIKIVDQAFNWGAEVSGALDHSDADFEWADDDPRDTDNPAVENLLKWYSYSLTIWMPSNLANRSYALVRFPEGMTAEDYLRDYHGPYDYIHTIGSQMRNEKAYLIPNSWILDGVNLSNNEVFVYGALGDGIDLSYSPSSDVNKDPQRFGKIMRRKIASVQEDGRTIYKDTNDSYNDFTLDPAK